MDDNPQLVSLEINAVVAEAETVKKLIIPLQASKTLEIRAHHFLGQPSELAEDLQLKLLGHLRQFGGAGGVEDDLEGAHESVVMALD